MYNIKKAPKSGFTLHTYKNPALHGFCLCLYIRAGAMYENAGICGISHFWEHMLFRNINRAADGKLYRKIDSLGATVDACTYRELIQIKISGASEKIRECMEILSLIFTPFYVPKPDIDTERKRVKSEIRESDEATSLDSFTRKIVWKDTTLENPITGKIKDLNKMGVNTLADFQKSVLTPENSFFCLTGAFDDGDVTYLEELIDSYSHAASSVSRANLAPIPSDFMKRDASVHIKNSPYHRIRFNFDADCARYTAAEGYILYDLLFAGESALLFKVLSEDSGLVYSYDSCFEKYSNIGNLYFGFEVAGGKTYEAIEKTVSVLRGLRENPYGDLETTKAAYIINTGLLLDDPSDLNWEIGYEYGIMGTPFESLEARREAFRSVTPERIRDIAREIFRSDNLILTLKENSKKIDCARIREQLIVNS